MHTRIYTNNNCIKITMTRLLYVLFVLIVLTIPTQVFAAGEKPQITYPTNGQIVQPGVITVRWDAVPGASNYVCYTTDLTTGSNNNPWIDMTNYVSFNVTAGHQYRFAVEAHFFDQSISERTEITFTVGSSVTGVTLSPTSVSLKVNESTQLSATVLPQEAGNKNIRLWKSSQPSVATVDSNGVVKAISKGSTTISCYTEDGNFSSTCIVTVEDNIVQVTSVSLSHNTISLEAGKTIGLTATVMPENATNKVVQWRSSNHSVAAVDANGNIAAVSVGTATIKAVTEDGNKMAECMVTVTSNIPEPVKVTSITLNPMSLELEAGKTSSLSTTILPTNASDKTILWSSSNANVAMVDTNGIVQGVNIGSSTITAKTKDGNLAAYCAVRVIATTSVLPVYSVTISQNTLSILKGNTGSLYATVYPTNATNKKIMWTSNDTRVATVDSNGLITAFATGTVTITAKTEDGNKTATCIVTVTTNQTAVSSVTMSKNTLWILQGNTSLLYANVYPTNATNKKILWTSSDTKVATVDSNGRVTAVATGTTTITAKTEDGNKTTTCIVTVTSNQIPIVTLSLQPSNISLTVGKSVTIAPLITPTNATNKTVTWSSSQQSIATVDVNGVVRAVAAGTTIITATANEGKKQARSTIVVVADPVEPDTTIPPSEGEDTLRIDLSIVKTIGIIPQKSAPISVDSTTGYYDLKQIHTIVKSDGTVSVMDGREKKSNLAIYEYNTAGTLKNTVEINKKMAMVGAFTADTAGNYYILYGKENDEGDRNSHNIAVVKYSSSGKELNSFSLEAYPPDSFNGVKKPFHAGYARLEISGDMIAAYFATLMFKSNDGLNHQASYGFVLNINTFEKITNAGGNMSIPYTSHSFNEAILPVNNGFVFTDLGDAYPRAFNVNKLTKTSPKKTIQSFTFEGAIGENYTGATLGGLEKTNSGYILAGSYKKRSSDNGQLLVLTIDENLSKISEPIWLTSYDHGKKDIRSAKIVQVSQNRYLILWQLVGSYVSAYAPISYAIIVDGAGNKITSPVQINAEMNPADELRYNPVTNAVYWATTEKAGSNSSSWVTYENLKEQTNAILYSLKVDNLNTVPATNIRIPDAITLSMDNVGKYKTITPEITPSNSVNRYVMWISSNPSIVSVDRNGRLEAKKEGNVTITGVLFDNFKTVTCKVTVSKASTNTNTAPVEVNNKIYINGKLTTLDMPVMNKNSRTYYPFRKILESLGATVSWDQSTRTASGELNGTKVEFQIDQSNYRVNGDSLYMGDGINSFLYKDRTYIPIRLAAEALGFTVTWDEKTATISISK